jgi:hypothetical protein
MRSASWDRVIGTGEVPAEGMQNDGFNISRGRGEVQATGKLAG